MEFSWQSAARLLPLWTLLVVPVSYASAQAVSFGEIRPFVVGLVPVVGNGGVGGVSIDAQGVVTRSDVESLGRLRDARLKAAAPIDSEMQAASPMRKISLRRLQADQAVAARQREVFEKAGFSADEVERGMEPLLSFQAQLADEIEWYENVRRGKFPIARRLTQLGQLLIALRIASGLTQRGLADRLAVSESVVSRDERNEYHGITIERAQRVLDALQASISTRVEGAPKVEQRALTGSR